MISCLLMNEARAENAEFENRGDSGQSLETCQLEDHRVSWTWFPYTIIGSKIVPGCQYPDELARICRRTVSCE